MAYSTLAATVRNFERDQAGSPGGGEPAIRSRTQGARVGQS